jgi:hypothetical protein
LSEVHRQPRRVPEDSSVTILLPDFCPVPDLSDYDQWVLWRREQVKGRETKIPYRIDGRPASSTEPRDWSMYSDALAAWRRSPRRYAGLGFVFTKDDPFTGIDIDDCLTEPGEAKPWAHGVIHRFADTYMEISPSGRGVKIWARGNLPANVPGVRVEDGAIELYDHSRYFTYTGRAFRGAPLQVEDHRADVTLLYQALTARRRKGWQLQPLDGGRIPYGQQHSTLVSIAGTLRARRVCDEAIEACLQVINERQCEKPGPRENISRIIRSSTRWSHSA